MAQKYTTTELGGKAAVVRQQGFLYLQLKGGERVEVDSAEAYTASQQLDVLANSPSNPFPNTDTSADVTIQRSTVPVSGDQGTPVSVGVGDRVQHLTVRQARDLSASLSHAVADVIVADLKGAV